MTCRLKFSGTPVYYIQITFFVSLPIYFFKIYFYSTTVWVPLHALLNFLKIQITLFKDKKSSKFLLSVLYFDLENDLTDSKLYI